MGRISKRGSSLRKTGVKKAAADYTAKRYKAGIYARISSAQGYKTCRQTSKNESIELQIEMAKKFVEEFNQKKTDEVIDIVEYYTDLGKTGSNFEREGFLRLMQDIRLGEINCVIIKDLSRFGRNYLEAGNYIEKIFPFLGVRFIAVSDGFDTGKAGNENKQMASEIKNLVNDMYAKDFSKKAKLHLKQRREEGSYVGGPPPYGYTAEWNGKRRILVPDEDTAGIVRFIYEKFVETESYTAVADELNRRRLNPPAMYKKTKEVYHTSDMGAYKGWNKSAVERMLKSETYTGMLVQGKTSITARNEKNRIHKPEGDWVITKDTHKPLVDRELYQKSVEIRQKIRERTASHVQPAKGHPASENIFDSVLYCGICGRKMTGSSCMKEYADGAKAGLADILLSLIRMEFAVFLNKHERYIEYGEERIAEAVKRANGSLREAESRIRRLNEEESIVYMDYRAGKILRKEYMAFKMQQENKRMDLERQRESQEKEIKALDRLSVKYLAVIKALLKLKSGKELKKDMVEKFISKIYVYPEKRIEVIFTFTADYMEGAK